MKRRILIAEDDKKMAELIRLYLEKDRYEVLVAHDGHQALETARQSRLDLIILDLMLPRIDGLDICRTLRDESDVPIIMLTARGADSDKLSGFEAGADDYITKPFNPREVVARVRAVLRRAAEKAEPSRFTFGEITLDTISHQALLGEHPLLLTPKEFKLLALLMKEPGRAYSRLELLEEVFGMEYEGTERTLDVHIMNLRKKIEPDPAQPIYIQTVYGVGYRFAKEVNHES